MKVPYDMKLMSTTKTNGKNEGAIQIVKGNIGVWANLYSQSPKDEKRAMAVSRRAISYGEPHPALGAWLYGVR